MSFQFRLARPEDDGEIRRLYAQSSVPGLVELAFEREPSFLDGCRIQGPLCQVVVGRNAQGRLAAVASRSVRPHFVDGQPRDYGYLGGLRVAAGQQGRWLLSGGFRYLRELHGDGRAPGYVTTITEGNRTAEGVLVRRARPGFPRYEEMARICTLSIFCRASRASAIRAAAGDLEEIVAFLRREGPGKQLFPAWSEHDFLEGGTTPGFRVEDFLLLRQAGRLVGTGGLWDQSAFKQTVVRRYHGLLSFGRKLAGLPPAGSALNLVYAAFLCVEGNRPELFRRLLEGLLAQAAVRGHAFLVVGLAVDDPLLQVARGYRHVDYHSRLYRVRWKEADDEVFDDRVPYVEVACL